MLCKRYIETMILTSGFHPTKESLRLEVDPANNPIMKRTRIEVRKWKSSTENEVDFIDSR